MRVVKHIPEIDKLIKELKSNNQTIGFVPTMGSLHAGHLALVSRAKQENDIVITSIFVNPIQFNNKEDLKNYPRDIERDILLLSTVFCDYIFNPDEKDMYPVSDNRVFSFGELETVMESKFRPGHFNGVAIVVSKLFEIIKPEKAYFGEKDYQQLQVIKSLVEQLNLPVEIIPCPIVREDDGLAMSSRNKLLTPENRKNANLIYSTLIKAKELSEFMSVGEIKEFVVNKINEIHDFEVEYFEISNSKNLIKIVNWDEPSNKIGCIAVYAGKIRLIDNLKF